jgi:hypothetical protein
VRKRLPSQCIYVGLLIGVPTLALVFMPFGVGISLAHDYEVWVLPNTLVHSCLSFLLFLLGSSGLLFVADVLTHNSHPTQAHVATGVSISHVLGVRPRPKGRHRIKRPLAAAVLRGAMHFKRCAERSGLHSTPQGKTCIVAHGEHLLNPNLKKLRVKDKHLLCFVASTLC